MPFNHLILWHPLLLPSIFPSIRVFSNKSMFTSVGQGIGTSTLKSVLPMSIQGWFPLRMTGLISMLSKGLSGVFSGTTVWYQHLGEKTWNTAEELDGITSVSITSAGVYLLPLWNVVWPGLVQVHRLVLQHLSTRVPWLGCVCWFKWFDLPDFLKLRLKY